MEYEIYKMNFLTGVHFGDGMLNQSGYTFCADTLFSALYIEALKLGEQNEFLQAVQRGDLLLSDGLPYVGDRYMIPKPMLYIESSRKGDSEEKKKYKKLKYFPVEHLEDFLRGALNLDQDPMHEFGHIQTQTMAAVRGQEETTPFYVGRYHYREGNGLYMIASYKTAKEKGMLEELMDSLSLVGIGGKKSSGLGKFTFSYGKKNQELEKRLREQTGRIMTLSVALPKECEMERALEGATYLLQKRSGFVASENFADEARKKKDIYVFAAGSCFHSRFAGDIYDVSSGGNHPVYRYAKPLFMGV